MTGHLCTFDDLGQFRSGTSTSKHLKLGLGIPLLVDVHAVWFDWVCGDDEVAATRRGSCRHHGTAGRREEGLAPSR